MEGHGQSGCTWTRPGAFFRITREKTWTDSQKCPQVFTCSLGGEHSTKKCARVRGNAPIISCTPGFPAYLNGWVEVMPKKGFHLKVVNVEETLK
jgi:hypothetical protein